MNQSRGSSIAVHALRLLTLALLLVAGLPFLASPAGAAPENYTIDPDHSAVGFSIRHLFSKVPGRFTKFEGKIIVDKEDWSKGSAQLTIDAASIDTNEPKRDQHLRSADFFDAAKQPKITFQSTGVKQTATNKLQLMGNLTIKGVTKPVTLDVDVLGFGPGYGGVMRAGFEAHTKINRQDFGVAWNDVIEGGGTVLGDEVEITINVEAAQEKPKAAPSPTAKKGN